MIESNIVNWIELGDSMQLLDSYYQKKRVAFFNVIRIFSAFKSIPLFLNVVFLLVNYAQILLLGIVNVEDKDDSAINILNYVKKVILLQYAVNTKGNYIIALGIIYGITVFLAVVIIYLLILIRIGKLYTKSLFYINNLLICLISNYALCPIIILLLKITHCKNGVHVLLDKQCYKDISHILFFVINLVFLIFYLAIGFIISVYYNNIGNINKPNLLQRTNCNYEIFFNVVKIIINVVAYVMTSYYNSSDTFTLIYNIFIFLFSGIFMYYIYVHVYYYNNTVQYLVTCGWVWVAWFNVIVVIKQLIKINDTTLFFVIGFIFLAVTVYFIQENRKSYILSDFSVFDATNIKDIEVFTNTLISLINSRSMKGKTILRGLIQKFEDIMKANNHIEKYNKLTSSDKLKKNFNSNVTLPILSIIFIIYEYHIEKSTEIKNDVLLIFTYFLINRFKNVTYAIFLNSKYKMSTHKEMFYKYLTLEEIKEFFMNKISKKSNKESIKHVEIGSAILHNLYSQAFKLKIYDAACNQIDYFDVLKNTINSPKNTENFLKLGEDILKLRKEILNLWEKTVELNPFSDENEKDYMVYLEMILQDDILARNEEKKYNTNRTNKLIEMNNTYHSLFVKETSSVLLVDGYSSRGKILYTTPNFPLLFSFSEKEVINITVDDLLPNIVASFHNEVVDDTIKYRNLSNAYNSHKPMLLKGKTGGIFNINLYLKVIPNFSYGLIYIVNILKVTDHSFVIVLDSNFIIDGISDFSSQNGINYTMNMNYGLSQSLCGHHIGVVIPELLLQLNFNDNEFHIEKSDIDLKGNLYPVNTFKEIESKVENVLNALKQKEAKETNEEFPEYDELIKTINEKYTKSFSVFYKVMTRSFMNGKHKYYRVCITNDLIAVNEEADSGTMKKLSISEKPNQSQKMIKLYGGDKGEGSERRGLLDDEKPKDNNDNNNNNKNNNNNQQEEKKNNKTDKANSNNDQNKKNEIDRPFSHPSSMSSFTHSSMDSASFNKLKNGIMDKRELTSMKIMKYLSFVFIFASILLIILNSSSIESNFENLRDYLNQNLFFNHTKISVSCLYTAIVNLKWVKDEYFDKSNSTFYSDLVTKCIDDIKTEKENGSYFYDDFKNVLDQEREISVEVLHLEEKDTIMIDIDNIFNLFISNGLKFISNLDEFFKDSDDNDYEITEKNLQNLTLELIYDEEVKGFKEKEKKDKIDKNFSPFPVELIIYLVIELGLFGIFGFFVFKLNEMEKMYLEKLIMFHSVNFDLYLKSLEDLKKKLRNDSGDDEDKVNDLDFDLSKDEEKKKKKEEDQKDAKKDEEEDKETLEKEKRKKNLKKKQQKSKQNKFQQQRNAKKRAMSKYFFTWNLLLIIKILVVLLVSFTYYIIVSLLESSKKNDYLSFDNTTDSIEGVYKSSFDIFLLLKTELTKYEESVVENKADPAKEIYTMSLPNNNEISTPKLGNLLMPLVNDLNSLSSSAKTLNTLYNADACSVLFTEGDDEYVKCSTFWSKIIVKGMEQAITQMGGVINNVIDELNSLNIKTKEFSELFESDSAYSQYEMFIEYYLLNAYFKTVELFKDLKEVKVKSIYDGFKVIEICYIVGVIILFFVLVFLVYECRVMFNTFLNFVGIVPVKYLIEDDGLYKNILKLEQHIF